MGRDARRWSRSWSVKKTASTRKLSDLLYSSTKGGSVLIVTTTQICVRNSTIWEPFETKQVRFWMSKSGTPAGSSINFSICWFQEHKVNGLGVYHWRYGASTKVCKIGTPVGSSILFGMCWFQVHKVNRLSRCHWSYGASTTARQFGTLVNSSTCWFQERKVDRLSVYHYSYCVSTNVCKIENASRLSSILQHFLIPRVGATIQVGTLAEVSKRWLHVSSSARNISTDITWTICICERKDSS